MTFDVSTNVLVNALYFGKLPHQKKLFKWFFIQKYETCFIDSRKNQYEQQRKSLNWMSFYGTLGKKDLRIQSSLVCLIPYLAFI